MRWFQKMITHFWFKTDFIKFYPVYIRIKGFNHSKEENKK